MTMEVTINLQEEHVADLILLHPNISTHILHTVLCIFPSYRVDKENLFNNQKFLLLVIISFILVAFMCESRVITVRRN